MKPGGWEKVFDEYYPDRYYNHDANGSTDYKDGETSTASRYA